MSKSRVAIFCGGLSSEHEISCISASGVLAAIDRSRFEPILIGITKSGSWIRLDDSSEFVAGRDGLPAVPERSPELFIGGDGIYDSKGSSLRVDLAFPLLHGPYGEDGTIQGLFEMAGIAYVGSGVLASAVAMDKCFAKAIYQSSGLKVAAGLSIHQLDWQRAADKLSVEIAALGFPLFIKPARGGSSRGTSKVKNTAEIPAAIAAAHSEDPRALVEVAVKGREIECAVLEIDGVATASILGEIRVHQPHEFYDFDAKYLDGSTTFDLPANLPAPLTEKVKTAAVTAFTALGCEGLARVDFFVTDDSEVTINEVNTMPGFTPKSVFPMLWLAMGKSYADLITTLCESALRRPRSVVR